MQTLIFLHLADSAMLLKWLLLLLLLMWLLLLLLLMWLLLLLLWLMLLFESPVAWFYHAVLTHWSFSKKCATVVEAVICFQHTCWENGSQIFLCLLMTPSSPISHSSVSVMLSHELVVHLCPHWHQMFLSTWLIWFCNDYRISEVRQQPMTRHPKTWNHPNQCFRVSQLEIKMMKISEVSRLYPCNDATGVPMLWSLKFWAHFAQF